MFRCNRQCSTHHPTCQRHVPTLWRYRFGEFDTVFYQEIILSSGGMDRSEIHGIDFRFQHLVGDHLFGGKINWERRKMQIHAPLNIVKMYWWSEFYPTKIGKNADLSLYLQSPKLTNPHEYDTKTNTGKANIRKVEKFLQPPYSARENHSWPTPPAPDSMVCGAAHTGHTHRLAGGVGVVRHLL